MGDLSLTSVLAPVSDAWADVIFVHGLGGDATDTWHPKKHEDLFWPRWLADDIPQTQVWTLGYPADATRWAGGTAMALPDRARSVLDYLLDSDIGKRPLYFVTHSLGGLLVKQMLRLANDFDVAAWQPVARQTKGVVFLATPHSGSALSNLADALRIFYRPTNATKDLQDNSPYLRDLGTWYSQNAVRLGYVTQAYFETQPFGPRLVVDETSADPKVTGTVAIPVDGDHFAICKPADNEKAVYRGVRRFLRDSRSELERLAAAAQTRPPPGRIGKDKLDAYLSAVHERFIAHLRASEHEVAANGTSDLLDRVYRERAQTHSPREGRLVDFVDEAGSRVLVLGEGGGGKTTSLLQLAADAASRAELDETSPIPIYVELRNVGMAVGADFGGLVSLIVNTGATTLGLDEDGLTQFWRSADRPLLLLLDGLNEVSAEYHDMCVASIDVLASRPPHRSIVTSRPGGAADGLLSRTGGLVTCDIIELEPGQVRAFLAHRGASALAGRMGDRLEGLARNPFMLIALVKSCARLPADELPANMGGLYFQFLDRAVFAEREPAKGHARYDYDAVKKPVLAMLADRMTAASRTRIEWDSKLEDEISVMLEATQTRLKRKRAVMPTEWTVDDFKEELTANGVIRFVGTMVEFMHHSVQEYYTAVAYMERPEALAGMVPSLVWRHVEPSRNEPPFSPHAYAKPCLMLAGLLKDSSEFMSALAARDPLLAAQCLGGASFLQPDTRDRFRREWLVLLDHEHARYQWYGCQCLAAARLPDESVINRLIALDKSESVRQWTDLDSFTDEIRAAVRTALRQSDERTAATKIIRETLSRGVPVGPYSWPIDTLNALSPVAVEILVEHWRESRGESGRESGSESQSALVVESLLENMWRGQTLSALEAMSGDDVSVLRARIATRTSFGVVRPAELRTIRRQAIERFGAEWASARERLVGAPDEELVQSLEEVDPSVRAAAVQLVGERRLSGAADALIAAAVKENTESSLRDIGVALTACIGGAAAARLIDERVRAPLVTLFEIDALDENEMSLGAKLATVLGGVPVNDALPVLVALLELDDARLDSAVVRQLRDLGDVRGAVPVAAVLKRTSDASVAGAAIAALATLGTEPALEALLDALTHLGPSRLRSVDYEGLDGSDTGWGSTRTPSWGSAIHDALGGLAAEAWLRPRLIEMLQRPRAAERRAAALELARLRRDKRRAGGAAEKADETEDAILGSLACADADAAVRQAVAMTLRWSSGEIGIRTLVHRLRSGSDEQRVAAAEALGIVEDENTLDDLRRALDDPSSLVRIAAASAINKFGETNTVARALHTLLTIASANEGASAKAMRAARQFARGLDAIYAPIIQALEASNDVEARRLADERIALTDDDASLFWWRAGALERLGQPEAALADYERAGELAPGAMIFNARANLLSTLGRHEEALAAARTAAEHEGNNATAAFNIGLAQLALGQDARDAYERAVAILDSAEPSEVGAVLEGVVADLEQLAARDASFSPAIAVARQIVSEAENRYNKKQIDRH